MKEKIDSRLAQISTCLYRLSVKAIVVDSGKLLLVKEEDDEWWSLPGGGVDYGESVEEALTREMLEELGLSADDIEIFPKIELVTVGAVVDGIPKANLFYVVKIDRERVVSTGCVKETKWFAPEELSRIYMSPSIGPIEERLVLIIRMAP